MGVTGTQFSAESKLVV